MYLKNWDMKTHNTPAQKTRQDRAKYDNMIVLAVDKNSKEATIQSANEYGTIYHVTTQNCSCPDFQKRGLPCKHMYKLDMELSHGISSNRIIMLIIAIFFGYFGIHRFMVGKIGSGVLWLLTVGMFGFGWIYDIIMIATGKFTDKNGMTVC